MKQLTNQSQLNTTLGLIAAHARATSFRVPSSQIINFDSEAHMSSHVSQCCGAIVHFDLEQPYCAGCGEWCQPVVYGQAN